MFFDLAQHADKLCLIYEKEQLTYSQVQHKVDEFSLRLPGERGLFFLKANNDTDTLVAYLACLQARHVVLFLDFDIASVKLNLLVETYMPTGLICGDLIQFYPSNSHPYYRELAVLLSTSGSTGSPKQVALSQSNLQANAQSICQYLPIKSQDKTVTTLPMHYSYGLSVINSHLLAGACIVLNQHSVLSREFWQQFEELQISSFAGVPYSYDMLMRLRFTDKVLPSLRYFTQAGGRLSEDNVQKLANYALDNGKQFFVMYGQTEATARMAYMDQDKALSKPNSIGCAIPGGRFKVIDEQGEDITASGQVGELCYSGDNVMLGYCNHYNDLKNFDESKWLHTGDVGRCDTEGDYFITGRLKRFIKVFGQRVNLDDVEVWLGHIGVESYCLGEDNKMQVAVKGCDDIDALKKTICQYLQIHHSVVNVLSVSSLPVTANGKKDYLSTKAEFDG